MAETWLEEEIDVITISNKEDVIHVRTQNREPAFENENDNSDEDWSNIQWDDADRIRERIYDREVPSYGDDIIDYDYSDYFDEVIDEIAEDNGDPYNLTFDDLDSFLGNTCSGMGNYDSVNDLAQRAADYDLARDLRSYKEEILKYYAICYYINTFGSYIPHELAEFIEDDEYDYSSMDKLGEVEDFIDDWMSEHEGIEEYMPR